MKKIDYEKIKEARNISEGFIQALGIEITDLDVYKRQVEGSGGGTFCRDFFQRGAAVFRCVSKALQEYYKNEIETRKGVTNIYD